MRVVVLALALALVPAALAGDYRNPTAGKDVALQLPAMHLAQVRRNLVYRPGQRLDVYRPRNVGRRLPAVIFVHGRTGAESPKDWGQYVGWGQLAAASGLAGVTFNHRDDPADVVAAIRFVRANAAKLGIDGSRLCVAGYSAGVHPALLTALKQTAGRLRCAVAYYGALDAGLAQLSPRTYLRAGSLPVLVAKAGSDNAQINGSIDGFVARARALGAPVELVVHARGPHAFDVVAPGPRSREIMRRTLVFLRRHLAG
ncbi:MAG: alpha/beta hydrolase [Gaiellaceae bacterium]